MTIHFKVLLIVIYDRGRKRVQKRADEQSSIYESVQNRQMDTSISI